MGIDSSEVSVVIQGPVGPLTAEVVRSTRRCLPGAQLVLSTWEGADVSGLDMDETVLNADPGSVPYPEADGTPGPRLVNTNRMLRSTRSGIERADRPFLLKLRSDSPLIGAGALSWWGLFRDRRRPCRVFSERVVITSVATRPGRTMPGYLFHPSDCAHFGLTEDVRLLWSGREVDEADVFSFRPEGGGPVQARYWNEQMVWLDCLQRVGMEVDYPHTGFVSDRLVETSDVSIVNNFTVIEPWQFGVAFPTLRAMTERVAMDSYMWYPYWLALYRSLGSR